MFRTIFNFFLYLINVFFDNDIYANFFFLYFIRFFFDNNNHVIITIFDVEKDNNVNKHFISYNLKNLINFDRWKKENLIKKKTFYWNLLLTITIFFFFLIFVLIRLFLQFFVIVTIALYGIRFLSTTFLRKRFDFIIFEFVNWICVNVLIYKIKKIQMYLNY